MERVGAWDPVMRVKEDAHKMLNDVLQPCWIENLTLKVNEYNVSGM